jgi:putative NIF3 family GTP cyclohydrolase 1 type 2
MIKKIGGAISESENLDTVLKTWMSNELYSLHTNADIAEMSIAEIMVWLLERATPEQIFPEAVMRSWLFCYAQNFGYHLEEGGDE